MRQSLIALPLLFVAAGCGQKSDDTRYEQTPSVTEEAADEGVLTPKTSAADRAEAAPDIDTSVAPGVAFDFRYHFALASERIGAVQEEHAQACKKLGIAKCRVTGMDYKSTGNGDVSAMLAFKLDPAVATDFTRDAKKIVERAAGELTDANLTGTDLGSNIASTEANVDEINAELATIDTQMKMPGLSKQVRSRLVEQATTLREQLRELTKSKSTDKAALALTPVVFEYESSYGIPGLNGGSAITGAAAASVGSFMWMLKFMMMAIGVIAPWALFGGLIVWLIRRLRKKPVVADAS
jgi:Domain of unknown function (DUF4349)